MIYILKLTIKFDITDRITELQLKLVIESSPNGIKKNIILFIINTMV